MEKNCASCTGCGGCGSALVMTGPEIGVLRVLEQLPFLPVARRADSMDCVCLEPEVSHIPELTQTLALLEKKLLVDLDYRTELKGFDYAAYRAYPCRGSMALTARGQQVLELLRIQGAAE